MWNFVAHKATFSWLVISLHICSMWETICDAWASWSGWNFGPNSGRIPPILKYSFRIPPPPMKIVTESKSESFRIPPNENCHRVQIQEFQNTSPPQNENCQRFQIWEFQNTPSKMKIVTESKSESFRIPPPKMKIVTESKSKSFRLPPKWKLSQSPNPRVSEYPPKLEKLQISNFRIV